MKVKSLVFGLFFFAIFSGMVFSQEENMVEENVIEENMMEENFVPEEDMPEEDIMFEENFVPEEDMPEEDIMFEENFVPEENMPEEDIMFEENFVPEENMPEEDIMFEENFVPEENMPAENMPEENFVPDSEIDLEAFHESPPNDPSKNYDIDFKVYNLSKNNGDATIVGAEVGDQLLYELKLFGFEQVFDEEVIVNLSEILSGVDIVDLTTGNLHESFLNFPTIDESLDSWTRNFGWYVTVNDNSKKLDTLDVTFKGNGVIIPLGKSTYVEKIQNILPKSGPEKTGLWLGIFILFGLVVFGIFAKKSK